MLFHAKYFPYFSAIMVCVGTCSIVEKKEEFSLPYGQHSPKHQNRKTSGARTVRISHSKISPHTVLPTTPRRLRHTPTHPHSSYEHTPSVQRVTVPCAPIHSFPPPPFCPCVRPSVVPGVGVVKGALRFIPRRRKGPLTSRSFVRPPVRSFILQCLAPIPSKRSTRGGGIRTERTPDRNPLGFRRQSPS